MPDPFIGQIALFPIGYTPQNWADCDGRIIAISSNRALWNVLGAAYGGNGTTNFALPDLRGRAPVCVGQLPGGGTYPIGQRDGAEAVALTVDTIQTHVHRMAATDNAGTTNDPNGKVLAMAQGGLLAENAAGLIYSQPDGAVKLRPDALANAGGSKPHNNMQPSLVLRYCIALTGVNPERSTSSTS